MFSFCPNNAGGIMATPNTRSSQGKKRGASRAAAADAPDAIQLLKRDHAEVKTLFDSFEDADDDEQEEIAEQVCKLLTIHTTIEEELLYPAAKEAFTDEEDKDLVNEAEIEHASAKELIEQIRAMDSDDEKFAATVKVLSEQIQHHVKEEESELFPKLKKAKLDIKALGAELFERKTELMDELGVVDEESEE
jgi:hemerythrin superfamily protein